MRVFSRSALPHLLLAAAAFLSLSACAEIPHDRFHPLWLMLCMLPLQLGALLWVRLTQSPQGLMLPASDRCPAAEHSVDDGRH